ncbi:MAG: Ig-like domain repeat protein, partial [Acidobacteriota bacterium]|nr:Ig-like domain repeat protein [Acidobacteriota bacterium]
AMGGPGASFDFGAVQPNNVPPVANAGGPYAGNEGSPITFDGSASSSICGFPTLTWNFSDGGVGYGASPQHTFEVPGVYSGLLTATDATGLTNTTTFSVTVADLPPVTSAAPSVTTEWGVPVTLTGTAIDPGTAQQPFLANSWDFGDGSGGVNGSSATHAYAAPGSYAATFTSCDPESLCASSTTDVTVVARSTVLSYTGANSSAVTDASAFTVSLVDDQGAPVVGRTVSFFADGSATPFATASTNAAGTASVAYPFPLGSVGAHSIAATFAGDARYTASGSVTGFTVSKDGTSLAYTGATGAKSSHPVLLSATLSDDAERTLVGQTVSFTLGTQGCVATTDASGSASCTIAKLTQKSGTYVVVVAFAGTGDYLASSTTGSFKIG